MSKNDYTELYRKAAISLSLDFTVFDDDTIYIHKDGKSISFNYAIHGEETFLAYHIARRKDKTKLLFEDNDVPIFPSETFLGTELSSALNYAQATIGFPVVIKPVNQLTGKGVTPNIISPDLFEKAWRTASDYSKKIIVEKHYDGDDFRFLVCGGKVLAITQKMPAHVVGDGENTLKSLIENWNKSAQYTKSLNENSELLAVLERQKASLDSIPPQGEIIKISGISNFHAGAQTNNLDPKQVHQDYQNLAVQATDTIGLKLGGVDIMTTDISRPLKDTGAGVLEVNPYPGFKMHMQASNPIPDIAEKIILQLFESQSDQE